MAVSKPKPKPTSDKENETSTTQSSDAGAMVPLVKIGEMVLEISPVGNVYQSQPFSIQPQLKIVDTQVRICFDKQMVLKD